MATATENAGYQTLSNFFNELQKNPSDLKNFAIGLVGLLMTIAVIYVASTDPKASTNNFYIYCVFGVLPAIIGILIASNIFNGPIDINKFYFYGGILFIFILSIYMFYRILNPGTVYYSSYVLGFICLIVLLIGLAIIYRIFVRTILNTRGWMGFFLKFLFLIPCFILETLETVFAELKAAPKMVVILFILEIILILVYIYIPKLTTVSSGSIVLLDKPKFLTSLQGIGKANQLFMDGNEVDNPDKSATTIRQNYSLSMWFYVNQHADTYAAYSKETNVFRYGYANSSVGHPRVAYFNDKNDPKKADKFIVYSSDSSGILLDIPTQSWNQLVISYNKSVIDIFVNGNLERSMPLSNPPVYDVGDVIEVGSGDNTVTGGGLHGAICNVVYHKTPMTPYQVAGEYNLNRYRNPPTNT
jgi:hypothetical protein